MIGANCGGVLAPVHCCWGTLLLASLLLQDSTSITRLFAAYDVAAGAFAVRFLWRGRWTLSIVDRVRAVAICDGYRR